MNRLVQGYFSKLEMSGAEAWGRTAQDARSDIRELFAPDGTLLPPSEWPASIANSVEAFELKPDGGYRIRLVSKLAARRLILEAAGQLRDPLRSQMSALAKAIRQDLGLAEPEPGDTVQ